LDQFSGQAKVLGTNIIPEDPSNGGRPGTTCGRGTAGIHRTVAPPGGNPSGLRRGRHDAAGCPPGHLNRSAGNLFPEDGLLHGEMVRPTIRGLIRKGTPPGPRTASCASACLDRFTWRNTSKVCWRARKGEPSAWIAEVLRTLREHETPSANPNVEFESERHVRATVRGPRSRVRGKSDDSFLSFAGVMLHLRVRLPQRRRVALASPFDPFPYIPLNLALSSLAAVQAPVIMMSQNRQEAKDRLRAEHALPDQFEGELEIPTVNWKIGSTDQITSASAPGKSTDPDGTDCQNWRVRIDAGRSCRRRRGRKRPRRANSPPTS